MTLHAVSAPPDVGSALSYVEFTSNVNITATTAAAANTIVTAAALLFDGATPVQISFYAPGVITAPADLADVLIDLWEDSTDLGRIGQITCSESDTTAGKATRIPVQVSRFITPTAGLKTYSARAYRSVGDGVVNAGAGGVDTLMPGFIRIVRA